MPDLTLSRLFCCGSAEKDLTPLPPNSANDVRHAKRRGRRRKTKERKRKKNTRAAALFSFCYQLLPHPPSHLPLDLPREGSGREEGLFNTVATWTTPLLLFPSPPFSTSDRQWASSKWEDGYFTPPSRFPPVDPPPFFSLLPTRRRRMETDYLAPSSLPQEVHERFPSAFSIFFFSGRTKNGLDGRGLREETRLLSQQLLNGHELRALGSNPKPFPGSL